MPFVEVPWGRQPTKLSPLLGPGKAFYGRFLGDKSGYWFPTNSPGLTTGQAGIALSFTAGSSQYLSQPVNGIFSTFCTMIAVARKGANGINTTLVSMAASAANDRSGLYFTTGNQIAFFQGNAGGSFGQAIDGSSFTDTTAYHVFVGRANSATSRDVWIDGVRRGSDTTNITVPAPNTVAAGAFWTNAGPAAGFYFTGDIAAAFLIPRALTDCEVREVSQELFGYTKLLAPRKLWFPGAGGATEHATSGALAAQAATLAGTAVHKTLHTTSGALAAQEAAVAGTATHRTLHATSGALASQAASVSGTAAHSAAATHPTAGDLAAQAAQISGTAAHNTLHVTSGVLVAGSATLAGFAQLGIPSPILLQGNLGWRPEKFSRKRRFELEGLREELSQALYPDSPAPPKLKEPIYAPPQASPTLRETLHRVRTAAAREAPAATQARFLREAIEAARSEAETARRATRRRRQQEFLLLT